MPEERELEKQLKLVSKTGKYVVGRREVMSGLKGSKLLIWSNSANLPQAILDESKNLSIPAIKFNGNPVELGRACGIPFRVSVIAVKNTGDADIKAFSNSSDYLASASSALGVAEAKEVVAEEEKPAAPKPKKKKAVAEVPAEEKTAKKKKTPEKKKSAKKPKSPKEKPKKSKDAKEDKS
ncbi:MAG: ribosomal L7Ae/L30e/S12e/Gadd45 family protein [Nitrososphaerales archaeon]